MSDETKDSKMGEMMMTLMSMITFSQAIDFLIEEGKLKLDDEEKRDLSSRFMVSQERFMAKAKEKSEQEKLESEARRNRGLAIIEERERIKNLPK